jgi:hypothetical protein
MLLPRVSVLALVVSGCGFFSHTAEIRRAPLSPPEAAVARHASPIWLEIDPGVVPSQCVRPLGQRRLCFENVHASIASALKQSLWTSFPNAVVLGPGDEPRPGDYRLVVELEISAVPPSEVGPGWAASGRGKYSLVRDGVTLASAPLESRSRAEFAYGRPLGIGAGEVISAVASQIAVELGRVPETQRTQLDPYMASASSNVALSSSE